MSLQIINRHVEEYQLTWSAMRAYTDKRDADSSDQLWLVQHPAVFTQGLAGKAEHILDAGAIAVIQSDRGGQVTYHGLGQLVVYVLLDLARANLNLRQLVTTLEQAVIAMLKDYEINATSRQQAPGVYVDNAKICSIGLRIRRGYSYHGLALNVDMDLSPFASINPCGLAGMNMTQLKAFVGQLEFTEVEKKLSQHLLHRLG